MDAESLRQYLSANGIPHAAVTPLENGGVVNFIWRVTTTGGQTSIIKHASHHLRVNKSFLISLDRMQYEVQALRTIPEILQASGSDKHIQPPAVLHYDAENHIVQISDGGSRNVVEAYSDPALDIRAIGSRLGRWLASLHTATSSAAVLPTIKARFNNRTGKRIYRTSLNGLAAALARAGHDPALGSRMNERFGAMLETDEACLSHGDFWPANVVAADGGADAAELDLAVIDWELTRVGNGATDVGQFAAEAWLLDTFAASKETDGAPDRTGGRGLVSAFLDGYLGARALSDEDRIRVAVQFGTHMVYYPSILAYPTGSQQPAEMVRTGYKILKTVDSGDVASLKDSPIGLLWTGK